MPLLTSNRLADILILSAIFVLLVMISPVSAAFDYSLLPYPTVDVYVGDVFGPWDNIKYQSYCTGDYPNPGSSEPYYWVTYNSYPVTAQLGQQVPNESTYTLTSGYYDWGSFAVLCQDTENIDHKYFPYSPGYSRLAGARPAPSLTLNASETSGLPVFLTVITAEYGGIGTLVWNITALNSSVYSLGDSPASFSIDVEGEWVVHAQVTNAGGSDTAELTITGSTTLPPVADFYCSPINTTSPDVISCFDQSDHLPTSWLWQLTSYGVDISPGGSYGSGIFSATNNTENPQFIVSGSGMIDVRLTSTNGYGNDQEYKANYITISGLVPTPTPTPAVPWPNQTGVCIGSSITLGSGASRAFPEHYQLTSPYGDTFSGQYNIGQANYVTGYPFFTALKGQYVYQERNLTGDLHWQQSYVTDYCEVPATTSTTIPVTSMPTVLPYVTGGPTYNPYPVPTIVLSDRNDTITIGETWINISTIPTTLPPLPTGLNESHWREVTCNYGPTGALLCPWLNVIYVVVGTVSDIVFLLLSIGFLPISFIVTVYNFVSSLSVTILSSWLGVGGIIIAVIGQVVNAIPDKVKNVVTLIMCLDVFKQCYELFDWVN